MTRRSTIAERTRRCPVCDKDYLVAKPSSKQRFCGQSCAWKTFGDRVRMLSYTPEARKKRADARRFGGKGKTYVKLNSRHMHRVVAEQKIGRKILPHEVVHHIDGNKRNNHPENLEVIPRADHSRLHTLGMVRHRKTHCKNGHEFTPENTVTVRGKHRQCLACRRIYDNAWKKAKRKSRAKSAL